MNEDEKHETVDTPIELIMACNGVDPQQNEAAGAASRAEGANLTVGLGVNFDWSALLESENGVPAHVLWETKPHEVVYVKFSGERFIYAYNFDGSPVHSCYPKLVAPNKPLNRLAEGQSELK